ncbi:hypothetical protein LCGC14_0801800 [marine sediment metagenome]|uniref:Uncharacterized protein n=1 Tax=marine sediment metagenome TaxID=412755 RepID=A0A0F9S9E3_9ZZZZ
MLLTDEEIRLSLQSRPKITDMQSLVDNLQFIAKAQLKKVALDLDRKCTKTEGQSSFVEVYVQALLKEVQ